jgi:hypothetical protein
MTKVDFDTVTQFKPESEFIGFFPVSLTESHYANVEERKTVCGVEIGTYQDGWIWGSEGEITCEECSGGESREHRSQEQNRREAFKRMTSHPKFSVWVNRKALEMTEELNIEEKVDNMMEDINLLIETKKDGKWMESSD